MVANTDYDEPGDPREFIWVEYDKFAPENHKVSAFITSQFKIQTCEEGISWKHVTQAQRQWYWDKFVKNYRWEEKDDPQIRQVWYNNTKELYRQTIHKWRSKRKHPESVNEEQWENWTSIWDSAGWKKTSAKYKKNKNSEPAGPGTGTTKHIAGSKSYAMHVLTMRKQLKKEPTSWEIFLHTHQRPDGTFVDERSRQIHEQMDAYFEQAMTPFEDGTMPDAPSSHEINKQFMTIIGGPRKGKLYGLSTVASTIYPEAMTPRPRGSVGAGSSLHALREEARKSRDEARESREEARAATQRAKEADEWAVEARREREELRARVSSLEESVRVLVGGMPRGSHSRHSSQGRGSTQLPQVSPHTGRSSQGSREESRSSPASRGSPEDRFIDGEGFDGGQIDHHTRGHRSRHVHHISTWRST
ncbi:uncharacterized protein [Henckelia pumila]|uniref:uncharacterized protein n=1 Tax=Henckelia pumila TaxID=405737 RepID=UPI003C6DC936